MSERLSIRTAAPQDIGALERLFAEWGHPLPPERIRQQVDAWSAEPAGVLLVAVSEASEVLGMAAVTASPVLYAPTRHAQLVALVVGAGSRRRGVGRLLLAEVRVRAEAWGCSRLEVGSSRARDAAHAFYRSEGFDDSCATHARYVQQLPHRG